MKQQLAELIFEELPGREGSIGLITLNRQSVLNALNHAMINVLDEQLCRWQSQPTIKAVVIRASEGRAFCAGGDIRYVYEHKQAEDAALADYFIDEYNLNHRIYHFTKPYIALQDGITMGGGAGISLHGSHRVGTERLTFAMPETGIGFYPDVGTTHFLANMPHKIGYYLGLTGARISAADSLATGIIQQLVKRESFLNIIFALLEAPLPDNESVTKIIKKFALKAPHSELMAHAEEIARCFSKKTIEEILQTLETSASEWSRRVARTLKSKSPTSLKVTLHALQTAEQLSFSECIAMEKNVTLNFVKNADFFEGIRATIIDKDRKPNWSPPTLDEVTLEKVACYFN